MREPMRIEVLTAFRARAESAMEMLSSTEITPLLSTRARRRRKRAKQSAAQRARVSCCSPTAIQLQHHGSEKRKSHNVAEERGSADKTVAKVEDDPGTRFKERRSNVQSRQCRLTIESRRCRRGDCPPNNQEGRSGHAGFLFHLSSRLD